MTAADNKGGSLFRRPRFVCTSATAPAIRQSAILLAKQVGTPADLTFFDANICKQTMRLLSAPKIASLASVLLISDTQSKVSPYRYRFDETERTFPFRDSFRVSTHSSSAVGKICNPDLEELMELYAGCAKRAATSFLLFAASILCAMPGRAQTGGESLYKSKCAMCHGADGKGETSIGKMNKIRDLGSPEVQSQSDADLATIISAGRNKMPAYGKSLTPEQIKDLVTYLRTFAKKS